MPPENPWSRLKQGRLFQALAIYLGVAWVLLQVTDLLGEAFALPEWVLPSAFVLLLIGLFVVIATVWVQSRPGVRELAAAEEVPEAWELDTRDLTGALRAGRMPHLTWPRALLGGAAAFLLLTTVAATVVLTRGRMGASDAAGAAAPGIAVMPFTVSGEGSEVWREGMIDLLATNLDGAGGLRTIDARSVLARWREHVGAEDADAERALEAARATGARYALLGSAVSLGDRVRLSAQLYDLDTGEQMGEAARVEGPRDSLFAMIDAFSVAIVRSAVRAGAAADVQNVPSIASVTTSSMPALLAFLEGEALYRRAEFTQAIGAYEAAVAADSTFALPYFRLSDAYGWSQTIGAPPVRSAAALALEHSDRMTPRDAAIVRLSHAWGVLGIADSIAALRRLADQFPDDAEIWFNLGDAIVHLGARVPLGSDDAADALLRAIALDSTFAPAYIHAVELAIGAGDLDAARRLLDAYDRYGDDARHARMARVIALAEGHSALLDTMSLPNLTSMRTALINELPDRGHEMALITRASYTHADAGTGTYDRVLGAFAEMLAGRPAAARELAAYIPGAWGLRLRLDLASLGHPDSAALDSIYEAWTPGGRSIDLALVAGALAVDRGDVARQRDIGSRLLARADTLRMPTDSGAPPPSWRLVDAESRHAAADALDAYAQWKAGDAEGALSRLMRARRRINGLGGGERLAAEQVRLWTAELLSELGRYAEAAPWFASLEFNGLGLYRAAVAWENAGDRERAHAAWARALDAWRHAEPDFALLAEARAGFERTAPDR